MLFLLTPDSFAAPLRASMATVCSRTSYLHRLPSCESCSSCPLPFRRAQHRAPHLPAGTAGFQPAVSQASSLPTTSRVDPGGNTAVRSTRPQARAPRIASVVPRGGTRPENKPTPPILERLGYSRPSLTGLAHPRHPPACESGSTCPTLPNPAHRRWAAATGPTPQRVMAFQPSGDDPCHRSPSLREPQPVPG